MQQITILYGIVRVNISRRLTIGLFLLFCIVFDYAHARGPHHPKSEINRRAKQQQHINEHLAVETKHIQEDLHTQNIPTQKSVDEMSDEEKNYFYFKVHDLDGNDKLDGLEIFYSATHHHSESESTNDEHHQHEHEQQDGSMDGAVSAIDNNQIDNTNENHESETHNSSVSNPVLPEIDGKDEADNKNFNHIIDVLDNFLTLADLNNDGYLNYAEYAAAVKLGNAMANAEVHPEL